MTELKAIYAEREITAAQKKLAQTLRSQLPALGRQAVTFRPSFVEMDLFGKGHGSLYFGPAFVGHDKKLWNAFGLFDRSRTKQDIVVEINFSVGGRRTAGLLAEDDAGRRFILHSGGVGGGRKGVSQEAFLAWLKPAPVEVLLPNGAVAQSILIGELGADNLADRIESFVRSVKAFKDAVSNGLIGDPAFAEQVQLWRAYREEFAGRKRGAVAADLDYVTYHGDIVSAETLARG